MRDDQVVLGLHGGLHIVAGWQARRPVAAGCARAKPSAT